MSCMRNSGTAANRIIGIAGNDRALIDERAVGKHPLPASGAEVFHFVAVFVDVAVRGDDEIQGFDASENRFVDNAAMLDAMAVVGPGFALSAAS